MKLGTFVIDKQKACSTKLSVNLLSKNQLEFHVRWKEEIVLEYYMCAHILEITLKMKKLNSAQRYKKIKKQWRFSKCAVLNFFHVYESNG